MPSRRSFLFGSPKSKPEQKPAECAAEPEALTPPSVMNKPMSRRDFNTGVMAAGAAASLGNFPTEIQKETVKVSGFITSGQVEFSSDFTTADKETSYKLARETFEDFFGYPPDLNASTKHKQYRRAPDMPMSEIDNIKVNSSKNIPERFDITLSGTMSHEQRLKALAHIRSGIERKHPDARFSEKPLHQERLVVMNPSKPLKRTLLELAEKSKDVANERS